jgi:hypothetical protein
MSSFLLTMLPTEAHPARRGIRPVRKKSSIALRAKPRMATPGIYRNAVYLARIGCRAQPVLAENSVRNSAPPSPPLLHHHDVPRRCDLYRGSSRGTPKECDLELKTDLCLPFSTPSSR